ncbi:unnamed protein product, partial [Brenthis ino]
MCWCVWWRCVCERATQRAATQGAHPRGRGAEPRPALAPLPNCYHALDADTPCRHSVIKTCDIGTVRYWRQHLKGEIDVGIASASDGRPKQILQNFLEK